MYGHGYTEGSLLVSQRQLQQEDVALISQIMRQTTIRASLDKEIIPALQDFRNSFRNMLDQYRLFASID